MARKGYAHRRRNVGRRTRNHDHTRPGLVKNTPPARCIIKAMCAGWKNLCCGRKMLHQFQHVNGGARAEALAEGAIHDQREVACRGCRPCNDGRENLHVE